MEYGPEGERLFRGLAEGSRFLDGLADLLERTPEEESGKAAGMVSQITETLEGILDRLLGVSDAIRRQAIDAYVAREPARSDKVGRNEPFPCGSGRKWKRCCGAPAPLH